MFRLTGSTILTAVVYGPFYCDSIGLPVPHKKAMIDHKKIIISLSNKMALTSCTNRNDPICLRICKTLCNPSICVAESAIVLFSEGTRKALN